MASNEEPRKEFVDEDKSRNSDGGAGGDIGKKRPKSPVANKRAPRGGGRLHGYGPPSDKPFSSNVNKVSLLRFLAVGQVIHYLLLTGRRASEGEAS